MDRVVLKTGSEPVYRMVPCDDDTKIVTGGPDFVGTRKVSISLDDYDGDPDDD